MSGIETIGAEPAAEERALASLVLTNDDGIEDYENRLLPLAEALAAFARVTVVVSTRDRSGSAHFSSLGTEKRALESSLVYESPATSESGPIEVHAVEGYPADCVYLALRGILRDDPPDLLISGLNGGPNLGGSWLHSGTIGAARTAATAGIPALAVSGVDFGREDAVPTIAPWLARLARSSVVQDLEPGQYLTVGIPHDLGGIRGIRVAPRSHFLGILDFEQAAPLRTWGADENRRTVWLMQPSNTRKKPPSGSDVDLYRQGYIVVTPMKADEHDHELLRAWSEELPDLPEWPE